MAERISKNALCVVVLMLTATSLSNCGGSTRVGVVSAEDDAVDAGFANGDSGGNAAGERIGERDSGVESGPDDLVMPESARKCPEDMVHVEHDYCPDVERKCIVEEYSKANRITLCHEFQAGSTVCTSPRHKLSFCIDRYEYPNRLGAHPSWMVSWHDAEATCRHFGKRTCWDWEWEAACEGPDETPFPYGWKRDNTKCNIDNEWIEPKLSAAHSRDPSVANRELSRLDQSVPSGAMQSCVSGYGVYDLTGNLDEWVTRAGRDRRKSLWAGLKGGAWGHVRNACRPMTTSHAPEFTYYFISFRCCKEPDGAAVFVPPGSSLPPVVVPRDLAPEPQPVNPPGPSVRKVGPRRGG
ncbi:MAG: SUMF1/EgtB/PvdO family nonheme iron enzyme [Polyangiaceae bacterium]|nr:SUMF1/EgtB/PvdO family nonheme iron enzyme [Polyangiaceae bacterium]